MAQNWGPQSPYHWGSEDKYVQRDLEDQIAEEYRTQGREYQRTDINNSSNMSANSQPTIVIQDVLDLLKRGYTRHAKDDKGYGSIQQHYNLTGVQLKELFANPKLRQKKTIVPRQSLNIVDNDVQVSTVEQVLEQDSFTLVETPQPAQVELHEVPDVLHKIIEEAKQDVEVKSKTTDKEQLFS